MSIHAHFAALGMLLTSFLADVQVGASAHDSPSGSSCTDSSPAWEGPEGEGPAPEQRAAHLASAWNEYCWLAAEGFSLCRWVPPPMTVLQEAAAQTAAQRGGHLKERDRPLSDVQRDKFEDMLRRLTQERADVREAMVFALDNTESATEVRTLQQSRTIEQAVSST